MTAKNAMLINIDHQERKMQPSVLIVNEDVQVQLVLLRVVIVLPVQL